MTDLSSPAIVGTRRPTTIELAKEAMSFSAGHFTLFSPTDREPMHGHNFSVAVSFDTWVGEMGLAFDYRIYKNIVNEICKRLHHHMLVPTESPYLEVDSDETYIYAHFNQQKMPFLKSDVILMPLRNISVEELSAWIVEQLIADPTRIEKHEIDKITVKVFSAPGQSGSTTWVRKSQT